METTASSNLMVPAYSLLPLTRSGNFQGRYNNVPQYCTSICNIIHSYTQVINIIFRDWSAIVYLNTPTQGGDFIITGHCRSLQVIAGHCRSLQVITTLQVIINTDYLTANPSDSNMKVLKTAKPACGTVVGFSGDTLHGVKSLKKGERFAIGKQCGSLDISTCSVLFVLSSSWSVLGAAPLTPNLPRFMVHTRHLTRHGHGTSAEEARFRCGGGGHR